MMDFANLQLNYWIIALVLWELAWKGLALWKAAQKHEKYWFLALLFINTLGILPMAYLLMDYYKGKKVKHLFEV